MKDYMFTDKTYFVKLKEYKIIDDGIWIPKEELEELVKKYDDEYTKLFKWSATVDPTNIDEVEHATRELTKTSVYYHIYRDLVKLINQKKR